MQEIRQYYRRTYLQHRGMQKLQIVLDHLESKFCVKREKLKELMVYYRNKGEFGLCETIDIRNLKEENIIREGNKIYFALRIPDLLDM